MEAARAVKTLNQTLESLRMEKHPDKTIIGRTMKGFDFLGYHFNNDGLGIASNTARKHVRRICRLYEQQGKEKATSEEMAFVLGNYVERWRRWCAARLRGDVMLVFCVAPRADRQIRVIRG